MTYGKAHHDVKRVHGKASSHLCVECGRQAKDWALNHRGQVLQEESGKWYSTRIEDYDPMCVSCHRQRDFEDQPGYAESILGSSFGKSGGKGTAARLATDSELLEKYRESGRRLGQTVMTKRRVCSVCGLITSPPVMGTHQKSTGHSGWTSAELEEES